jgi:hypothetical protein
MGDMMAAFIPEEERGGEYVVSLLIDGKRVEGLTPKAADARGFPLSRIIADMETSAMDEVSTLRIEKSALETELAALQKRMRGLGFDNVNGELVANASE